MPRRPCGHLGHSSIGSPDCWTNSPHQCRAAFSPHALPAILRRCLYQYLRQNMRLRHDSLRCRSCVVLRLCQHSHRQ
jgi:hypothetical protein